MNYWKDLYTELAGKITAAIPEVRWVDLWHEQVNYLTEELPFDTPAVFLAFSTVNIDDRGRLAQDCNMQVDMYLFFETFSDTYDGSYNKERALLFFDTLNKLYALFHGRSGENYSEMRRVYMERESSGGSGNLYRISFQCLVSDYSAQIVWDETLRENAGLEVTAGKIPERPEDGSPLFLMPTLS